MDLQWHDRLIERLIKNNQDATIKDYMMIVGEEEESAIPQKVGDVKPKAKFFFPDSNAQIYGPYFDQVAFETYKNGGDVRKLAKNIGVMVQTIYRWRTRYKTFREAIILGKEQA